MRFQFLICLCFLPVLAFARPETLRFLDFEIDRAQAQAAGKKLAIAARQLDAYLASDSAKHYESEHEEDLPPAIGAILQQVGLDPESTDNAQTQTNAAIHAYGFVLFMVCDREHADIFPLRTRWAERAYDSWFLSTPKEETKKFSSAILAKARAQLLPMATGYFDSWLAISAAAAGCKPQALDYADLALDDSTNELADGILGMTRSGLLLRAANHETGIEEALKARSTAMAQFLRGGKTLAAFAVRNSLQTKKDALSQFQDFSDYDDEFNRTIALLQAPLWQVAAEIDPIVKKIRRHGDVSWLSEVIAALLAPEWPTALEVLAKRKQKQTAAAFVLAGLFDSAEELSGFNNHLLDDKDAIALVWQAYGKSETKAELERATKRITLSASEYGIAIITLFGHQFLLPSAESKMTPEGESTHWFTLAEIQANFRNSYAFQELMGEG
jgi:hypothetical protein